MLPLLSLLLVPGILAQEEPAQSPLSAGPVDIWVALNETLGGRVFQAAPLAQPCFDDPASDKCKETQELYQNEKFRTKQASGYTWGQWETCQASGAQCLLDFAVPTDKTAFSSPNTCRLGSIPDYFIDVRSAEDVIAAFDFSRTTSVPLVVKNTGHDFKGRSSGQGTLALWLHNLKDISYNPTFVLEGCDDDNTTYRGVTAGAGVQFHEAFDFAEANQITVVGGSDATVGFVGGFLQGGGHGVLSPTLGLGVDRALEFKIVTPDGKLRTANQCQNEDLFFALRGGGGGTFGVVLSATILAAPAAPVQAVVVSFPPTASATNSTPLALTTSLWSLLADHVPTWADAGWGGYSMPQLALFATQRLDGENAKISMKPLLDWAEEIKEQGAEGVMAMAMEFPSWGPFFTAFMTDAGGNAGAGKVGYSVSLTSRLVPRANFATPETRSALVDALVATSGLADTTYPGPPPLTIIQITAPSAVRQEDVAPGRTSVTPAWRHALYHVTSMGMWNWNATAAEIKGVYDRTSKLMDFVRKETPIGAYLNEADVYEPDWEQSFWGAHYTELLSIKMKYDPDRLLDCWQCVGWSSESDRYACYL
ncbi:FAD-binding domain-containing protein [Mycena indigotica]|uniref:FAD-binding domain-containing protein n=1 Tax=Mycena indigotica TaxID=2126181 RepID=A0A8H6S175_9AGAR|nr:FAD-binding domain-containing protein [Mycena indigotica]KAF7290557.1 FAD-binding domain-containing protein [Mycena indigotica]